MVNKSLIALGAALILIMASGSALAQETLSCQVQGDLTKHSAAPKVTDFTWSTAHNSSSPTGAIATSIGKIAQGRAQGSITLSGKPVQLPNEVRGVIRFGKVYDYGGRVALAYRVEREFDSSATPSEVVFRLDKTRVVAEAEVLPGEAAFNDILARDYPDHCTLVE